MNEQKILTPELEARVHQAVDNFMQGYGCCQMCIRDRHTDVLRERTIDINLASYRNAAANETAVYIARLETCLLYTSGMLS